MSGLVVIDYMYGLCYHKNSNYNCPDYIIILIIILIITLSWVT